MDRREESTKVKQALVKAGYKNVSVGHGTGTARGWLEIRCSAKPGQSSEAKRQGVLRIAKAITKRHGDYDGNIMVKGTTW